jgi:hypothetical protein
LIFIYQDDISEGNETKRKMLEQLTPAHMKIMLISHVERELVNTFFLFLFKESTKIVLSRMK